MSVRADFYYGLRWLASIVVPFGREVRLAHAFRSAPSAGEMDDIGEVLRILAGESALSPRPPSDVDAVSAAERLMGMSASPIYTYAGCLHPALGAIGLIISPNCLPKCLQGVSRCDTGGLVGRRGSFVHLPESDVAEALTQLTCHNGRWRRDFSGELASSYRSVTEYVAGSPPNVAAWRDARARCISSHMQLEGNAPDRRLWTWEVRLVTHPRAADYEALVVSAEVFKKLDSLRRQGARIPDSVKIIRGGVGPTGVHYFHETETTNALIGRRSP